MKKSRDDWMRLKISMYKFSILIGFFANSGHRDKPYRNFNRLSSFC